MVAALLGRAALSAVALGGAVLAAGCSGVPGLVPDTRGPADFARQLEPKCASFGEADAATLLSRDALDSVEPAYDHVKSGPVDREARLRGAKLHVRPLPGLSRETIARRVECHESRVVLGKAPSPPDDPYTLPGHWVDTDVSSEGDGFVIALRSDSFGEAQEILARAKRFFGGSPAPAPAPTP